MSEKQFNNKVYFVCYADGPLYEKTQGKFIETYKKVGIDKIVLWNKKVLSETDFYKKKLAKLNEMFGSEKKRHEQRIYLLAWQPYIILDLLKKVKENDFIIYADCSSKKFASGFHYSVNPLLNYLHNNDLIYPAVHLAFRDSEGSKCNHWTKDETFEIMNVDKNKYGEKNMCQHSYSIWRKNDLCEKFLNEWLDYSTRYECILPPPSLQRPKNPLPRNVYQRTHQTILTLLIIKYNLKVHSPTGPFPDNIIIKGKGREKDKDNGIQTYAYYLKNHNYPFQLACENRIEPFVNI